MSATIRRFSGFIILSAMAYSGTAYAMAGTHGTPVEGSIPHQSSATSGGKSYFHRFAKQRQDFRIDPHSPTGKLLVNVREILIQFREWLNQHIGWLYPGSVKERALAWLAFSLAIPWLFAAWLTPFASTRYQIFNWMIAITWTALACWSGWNYWGSEAGQNIYYSTMIVLIPLLSSYYHYVCCDNVVEQESQKKTVSTL